jgi:hypothetical protein
LGATDSGGTPSTDTTSGSHAFVTPNSFISTIAQDIAGTLQGSLGSTLATVA